MNLSRTLYRAVMSVFVLLSTLGALGLASPAHAHADLESVSPAEGAVVVEPLHAVVLELSAPARLAWLALEHRDGTDATLGRPAMDGTRLTAMVGALSSPGTYELSYRAVTEDGHDIEGSYSFTVARSALTGDFAAISADTEPVASPAGPDGRPALWLLGGVGAIFASAVVRRAHARRPSP